MSRIPLHSGLWLDFAAPRPDQFTISDIAWGLSRAARFAGQAPAFYSVAQHCVMVSELVPAEWALEGLLHNAAEAFMGVLPSPLKALCPDFKEVERRIEAAVADRWCLQFPWPAEVKRADLVALATERRDLWPVDHPARLEEWPDLLGIEPTPTRIREFWPPAHAGWRFLTRFAELADARDGRDWAAAQA